MKFLTAIVMLTMIACLAGFFPAEIRAGGPATGTGALKPVSFIPHWVPQAQFAGYYVARHKGFYRKHGLDVTIIDGGPDRPAEVLLKKKQATFGTLGLSMALGMRDQGIRVVNIAQMVQRSALMLVAKKSSGIQTPRDLDGRKVGLWGGAAVRVQPSAFFKKFGIHPVPVRQSFSVNLFLRDGVDAASAMWYNEYHTILMSGIDPDELTRFFFYEYDLNFPEDGIYTLEETFNNDPEGCRDFVRASLDGWRYAFAHPDETLDLVMENLRKARIPATRVHQRWMLDRMADLMTVRGGRNERTGILRRSDYRRVTRILLDGGIIGTIVPFGTFFRQCAQ